MEPATASPDEDYTDIPPHATLESRSIEDPYDRQDFAEGRITANMIRWTHTIEWTWTEPGWTAPALVQADDRQVAAVYYALLEAGDEACIARQAEQEKADAIADPDPARPDVPVTSEHTLAEVFAASAHGGDWQFAADRGWFRWVQAHDGSNLFGPDEQPVVDGGWTADPKGRTLIETIARFGKIHMHKVNAKGEIGFDPVRGGSVRTARAVADLLSAMLATDPAAWDADPWALGVGGGKVADLKYREIRDRTREDPITQSTGVVPARKWRPKCRVGTFLDEVLEPDVVPWFQVVFGYTLTGLTREHLLVFLYGATRSGKGSLLTALGRSMGQYVRRVDPDDLMESRGGYAPHPAWLMDLAGRRLVVADEVKRGCKWSTGRVKALVSGEPIRARLMGQDFSEFKPQAQVILAGNHAPRLDSADTGMGSRLRVVAMNRRHKTQDKALQDKLDPSDMLRWGLDGAAEYAAHGLPSTPASVQAATATYHEEADMLAEFVELVRRELPLTASKLRGMYTLWCSNTGVKFPLSPVALNATLQEDYGLIRKRTMNGPVWRPIQVEA